MLVGLIVMIGLNGLIGSMYMIAFLGVVLLDWFDRIDCVKWVNWINLDRIICNSWANCINLISREILG